MTLYTALSLLLGLWILGHILVFGILFRKTKYFAVILSTILLVAIYVIKPATFDLPRYSVYFETGIPPWETTYPSKKEGWKLDELSETEQSEYYSNFFPHSPAFNFLLDVARDVLPHGSFLPRIITERHVADSLVLLVGILGLALLAVALTLLRSTSKESVSMLYSHGLAIVGVLGSLFFFVGSQNSLRQFLGSCFSVLALAAFVRSKHGLASASILFSFLFHPWSPALAVFSVLFVKARQIIQAATVSERWKNLINEYLLAAVLSVVCIIWIKLGIKLGLPYFTTYFQIDTSDEIFRTAATVKLALVVTVLVITDILAGRPGKEWLFDPASLRRCFLILFAPLVIYPEIFSRLLMFYFAVEMIYLVWAFRHSKRRVQLSGCVTFLAYALALNALNILLDKGWKEALFNA